MRCYELTDVFQQAAGVQFAGKNLQLAGENLPHQAQLVFDMFCAIYRRTSIVPMEMLESELERYGLRAQKFFRTRHFPMQIVKYYALHFQRRGFLRVVDLDPASVLYSGKLLE